MKLRILALALVATTMVPAAQADTSLTMAQVEARYPRMSPVHINKCDQNGDGLFNRTEQACVEGIYDAMYRGRNS